MVKELKQIVVASGSRYRLSKQTGGLVSQSELCRWLKGTLNLGGTKLDAIAAALSVRIVQE